MLFGLLRNKLKAFVDGLVKKEEEKQTKPAKLKAMGEAVEPVEEKILEEARCDVEKEEVEKEERQEKPVAAPPSAPAPAPAPVGVKEIVRERGGPRELAPKLGLFKQVTSFFSGVVTISESEVAPLLQDLELSLLESDVSLNTTHFLLEDLRKRLVGKRVARNALKQEVQGVVRSALLDLFPSTRLNLARLIKEKRGRARGEPFVILFLGPNGMGKTTAIAKTAFWLKQRGFSSVLAASDSFRKGAIQQLEHHGEKIGVRVVKHDYGADPTAVAFDAIAHARAQKLDVVLIDTAGRQETSLNLVKEMEKMNRVIKPDLRVFVGEAIAGHALVTQLTKFKEAVGIDALVLTKLDCDAKGGSAFSAAFESKTPILFVGVGQDYEDLREFDAAWLVENVLAS